MPKRKATKKTPASRRSSINVVIDHNVPEEERKRKLDAFIADFENERQARLRAMRDEGDNILRKINSLFHTELLKIPKSIRTMKYVEFRDQYHSNVNEALQMSVLAASQAEFDKIRKPTTVRKGRKPKATTTFETIGEDDLLRTVQRGKVAPPTTGRMTRTSKRTNAQAPPIWADTPLVTPAFNPRLMRAQRQTALQPEQRYTFLFDDVDSPKIEIPVNGTNVLLNKYSELNNESREALGNIRNMINKMLDEKNLKLNKE